MVSILVEGGVIYTLMSIEQQDIERAVSYSRLLEIWESDYGRDAGWIVEQWGEPIAVLTDPEQIEMFWVCYRIIPLTQDIELLERMRMKDFWHGMEGFVWRNREFGMIAPLSGSACWPDHASGPESRDDGPGCFKFRKNGFSLIAWCR